MSFNPDMTPAPGTRDMLTKLADRQAFLISLRRDCVRTLTSGGMMALLIININQFRRINSIFGLKVADEVLVRLAEMLRRLGRRQDLVARIGSDEFALILPNVMNEGHAVLAANKLLRELESPMNIDNERVPVSATVGIAICPTHASHPDTLLKHSELALLKARRSGSHYLVAEPVHSSEISDTWDLEIELGSAIENDELALYYQPQVDMKSGAPLRAEALMRWESPSRGLLRPGTFIPIAERTGQIRALTAWALDTALRQMGELADQSGDKIGVSINMPANAFQSSKLLDMVEEAIRMWGAQQGKLTLEVTESVAMADPATAFGILEKLRKLGCRISIDDFGTGYSSLSYFRDIPADELKIDQSFTRDIAANRANHALTGLMIELGKQFDMEVVAEGVENQEALAALEEMGCGLAQGNLIGAAMPFEDFCKWMQKAGGDWRKSHTAPAEKR